MRILSLKMEAFGSFLEKTEIDFTQFGDHDLYLISGETGSGKTTIFDAIMFALFGTGSGDERRGAMFRSEYADASRETSVTLRFRYADRTYTITRKPGGYEITKKRGEGTKTTTPYAYLLNEATGKIITGDDKVREEVTDILGVNRNQFKQISMLAQGEFKKLLTEKTENKKLMFRNLFHTGNYDRLLQELKDLQDTETEQYETSRKNLLRERDNVLVEKKSDFYEIIQTHQKKQDVGEIEIFLSLLQDYLLVQKNMQEQKSHEQSIISESFMKLEAEIQENNRLLELTRQINLIRKELPVLQKKKKELEAAFVKTNEDAKNIHVLNQKIGNLNAKLPEYKEMTMLSNTIQGLLQTIADYESQLNHDQNLVSQNETLLQHFQAIIEKKDEIVETINMIQRNLEREESQLETYQQLQQQLSVFSAECEIQLQTQKKLALAVEKFQKQKEKYSSLEDAYYASQAGLLARKIRKGEPCPVCGSREHDEQHLSRLLAELDHNISKERVDEEKKKKELFENQLNTIISQRDIQQGKIDQAEKQLRGAISQMDISLPDQLEEKTILNLLTDINSRYTKQKEKIEDLKEQQKEAANRKKVIVQAKESFDDLNQKQTQLIKTIETLNKQHVEAQADLKTKQERYHAIQEGLEFASEQIVLEKIQNYQQQITQLESAQQQAKQAVEEAQRQEQVRTSELSLMQQEVKDKQIVESAVLEDKRKILTDQINTYKAEIDAISTRMITDSNVLKVMKKEYDIFQKSEQKLKPIRELYRTMNGEFKDRIKIETFIQAEYFDRILRRASRRLYEMSNGQFELLRKEDSDDHRRKEGMEIEIWDYYTNSSRNVATLSGGETFLASLALALGLSDEIQQSAGGIHFDSLFIDEGFGSLDENALSKAIQVLAELSDTDCMIGIISHVTSLMERIEKQIVVTKDPISGSKVTIHTS